MKNILYLLLLSFFAISCEDKVEIPLETTTPKLVIDANIFWKKGTTGTNQMIKLSTTGGYYDASVPAASGAIVQITNSANQVFDFLETIPNSGEYVCSNFIPIINEIYSLQISYQGEVYVATEKLYPTPDILNIQQNSVQLFNQNMIQIKYFFQDNGSEDNYYILKVKNSNFAIPEYGVLEDKFFQGNLMFGFYTENPDNLYAGTILNVSVAGISKRYYNYMNKLISISGNTQGPFSTPPVSLTGNITNSTTPGADPLGYFHLSEISEQTYTVQ